MSKIVWIIVVNYRTGPLVVDCLGSLKEQVKELNGGKVIVIDNDSSDSSVEIIQSAITKNIWDEWVDIVPLKRNGGFAYGNNAGINLALSSKEKPDYILLLNPDTVVRSHAINSLVSFLESHNNVGIVGSRIENTSGDIESTAHRFPSYLSEFEDTARLGFITRLLSRYVVSPEILDYPHECDWLSGAALMLRSAAFEDIGNMDDSFFLYFEEVDYCLRAKSKGWTTWYVPESRVMHLQGAATGICNNKKRRPSYWYNSRRRYYIKHHGISGWLAADLFWSLGRFSYLLRRILRLGAKGTDIDPKLLTFDLLWGDFYALITGVAFQIKRDRGDF